MPRLQPFSLPLQVSADDGREDKIELELGDWILTATPAVLDNVRESMCAPPVILRAGGHHETHGFGWMFNRPNDPQGRRKPPIIRSHEPAPWCQNEAVSQPLLFGGKWHLSYSPNDGGPARPRVTFLRLSLNPLRFVRHQPRARNTNPEAWPPARLSKLPGSGRSYGEFSLDGQDNWLPDTAIFRAYASNANWERHLARYIAGVAAGFEGELHRSASGRAVQPQRLQDFRLGAVETVWEFAHPNPTELVHTLAPLLTAYSRDMEVQHFPPTESRTENCISIKITLRHGVALRCYAKTNRRVRFEIVHDEINVRELLGEEPQQGLPRQRRPWTQIPLCLAALRQRAAEELNTVLAYLHDRHRVPSSPYSPMRLIVAIATAVNDAEMAHTVLSLLNKNGIIITRRLTAGVVAAVRRLVEAGVIGWDEERRGYDITTPYREPLSAIRSKDLRHLSSCGLQRQRGRRRQTAAH